jgi:CobQ-like glutamine amidotransferase family enzyme
MQIIGKSFTGPEGRPTEGLGLLDCTTSPGAAPRMVGEIVVDPDPRLGLPVLSGYENHAGATRLGSGASPLGSVRFGSGNGRGFGVDGAWSGRVLGTYLHGPVLARNPALADLLLSWAVGDLQPLVDADCEDLREERLAAVRPAGGRRLVGRWRR